MCVTSSVSGARRGDAHMNKNLWLVLAVVASGCYVEINNDKGDSGDTGLPNDGSPPACEIVSPV